MQSPESKKAGILLAVEMKKTFSNYVLIREETHLRKSNLMYSTLIVSILMDWNIRKLFLHIKKYKDGSRKCFILSEILEKLPNQDLVLDRRVCQDIHAMMLSRLQIHVQYHCQTANLIRNFPKHANPWLKYETINFLLLNIWLCFWCCNIKRFQILDKPVQ